MYVVCASYAWSSSKPTRFAAGPAAAVDDTTAAALESSPAYQAAKRSGEALPKLRALRQLLGVHDAAAVLHHPRFWSMPLEKDLLPRHAYQVSLGAPATTTWCTTAALEQLLLCPFCRDQASELFAGHRPSLLREWPLRPLPLRLFAPAASAIAEVL